MANAYRDEDGLAQDAWRREAERLHQRYLVEVVEACGLCPWAEVSRRLGRMRTSVVLESGDAAALASLKLLDGWIALPEVEIGFLIYPRRPAKAAFDRFVAELRTLDAGRRPAGEAPFALAAFHPDAAPDLKDAERLVPFLRRSPDPCVQVVRMSSLHRVRRRTPQGTHFVDVTMLDGALENAPEPPLAEQIARANLETVRRMGVEALASRIEDILGDRDRSYARLACG
ncbi:MAG TPA: DUF1415 family protein [Polyangiaceae bacterium]